MGGYLKNKLGNVVFLFSGPISAVNPLEAKTKAIIHMVQHILHYFSEHNKIVLHTDSYTL